MRCAWLNTVGHKTNNMSPIGSWECNEGSNVEMNGDEKKMIHARQKVKFDDIGFWLM